MKQLNLPEAQLRLRHHEDFTEVFDPLRKKYIVLTEEEWVRQNIISFLTNHRNVPLHMMASERGLIVNGLHKRFDIVVYASGGRPEMIVECKAPHIKLDEEVMYQAARYNMALQVKYLFITNGIEHHCIEIDYTTSSIRFLDEIPFYSQY